MAVTAAWLGPSQQLVLQISWKKSSLAQGTLAVDANGIQLESLNQSRITPESTTSW